MGVPMITQRGTRASGRMAATVLEAIGLGDMVAETPAQYVALAAGWAGDRARLARLRGSLREHVRRSPLCDGPGFTRGLEATYRDLWRRWCRQPP
jgi:predicted O-linked N-acetylglucosamine transferase (SPINDLY family)